MSQDLLSHIDGHTGHISLNRPAAIHALNHDMVRGMIATLQHWRDLGEVQTVMIDHAASPDGDPKLSRGFCAGGDVLLLRNSALNDNGRSGRAFFYEEYQLNHLLFTYPKPVVAFMDGITMGAGLVSASPRNSASPPKIPALRCPKPGSVCSLMLEVAGICHGWLGGLGSFWR